MSNYVDTKTRIAAALHWKRLSQRPFLSFSANLWIFRLSASPIREKATTTAETLLLKALDGRYLTWALELATNLQSDSEKSDAQKVSSILITHMLKLSLSLSLCKTHTQVVLWDEQLDREGKDAKLKYFLNTKIGCSFVRGNIPDLFDYLFGRYSCSSPIS